MQIQNPVLTGSLTLNGLNITTGNLVTTGSNIFVGNQTITGSTIITGSLITTGSISLERGSLRIGDGAGGFSGFTFSTTLRQTNNNPVTLLGALRVDSTAGNTSYISGSGGLAIGKGTATSYLDVSGSTLITGSLGVTGPITGSSILSTGRITAQTLVVSTISSSVTFSSGSNIFGNNPANRQTFTGSLYITGSVGIDAASSFRFNGVGDTSHAVGYDSTVDGAFLRGQNGIRFITGTGGGVERMRISSAGTASFTANTLANSADAATINLKQNSTTANTGIYLERSGEQKGYYMYVGGSVDSLTFQRNNAGTKADVMALSRDGNVGIGTNDPKSLLDVTSTGTVIHTIKTTSTSGTRDAQLRLSVANTGTNDSAGRILFTYSTNFTEAARIEAVSDSGGNWADLRFGTGASGTERMRITSTGNIQIGCNVASRTHSGPGCRYNFTALNTPIQLEGICAGNGLLVIRDHTTGGSGVWLIDPNLGVICIASNIVATVSIVYSGAWCWCLTSGAVPRCLGYGFYSA